MKLLDYELSEWQQFGQPPKYVWNYYRTAGKGQFIGLIAASARTFKLNRTLCTCRFNIVGFNDLDFEITRLYTETYGKQVYHYGWQEIANTKKQIDEFIIRINQLKSLL